MVFVGYTEALDTYGKWADERSGANPYGLVSDGRCNVAVIPIQGDVVPYPGASDYSGRTDTPSTNPDDFMARLHAAEDDSNIKGVLVRID